MVVSEHKHNKVIKNGRMERASTTLKYVSYTPLDERRLNSSTQLFVICSEIPPAYQYLLACFKGANVLPSRT